MVDKFIPERWLYAFHTNQLPQGDKSVAGEAQVYELLVGLFADILNNKVNP